MFISQRKPGERAGAIRGFTMIELMMVVVIVGILATVAVFGVRRYINSAKTSEAMAMVNSIRAAEESYRDETFKYRGLSGFADDGWHPTATPSSSKHNWATTSTATMTNIFRELGVETNNPVYYTYTVVAGVPGGSGVPAPPCAKTFTFPTPQEPFYVVVAKGDVDDDGRLSYVVSHSFSSEIYVENEGE
jgi:type IV pilus assembly protein PilA